MVWATDIIEITGTTTLDTLIDVVIVDATSGSFTITLPSITTDGMQYKFKRTDSVTANTVTIEGDVPAETIDGLVSITLAPETAIEVQSLDTVWISLLDSCLSSFPVQKVTTLMRTAVDITLTGVATDITLTDPCRGTLSAVSGDPPEVTYTPNNRVPRWPERKAVDMFSYTGIDSNGKEVTGLVHICIEANVPEDRYIIKLPGASTDIAAVNTTALTETVVNSTAGLNSLATNNVDGIVFTVLSGTELNWWDPVSDASGTIDVSGTANFAEDMATQSGAAFDQDHAQLLILNDVAGSTASTLFYYRFSFETYETGLAPVVKACEQIFIYATLPALPSGTINPGGLFSPPVTLEVPTDFTEELGDAAWDPISKKIYIWTTIGTFYNIQPYDMRWIGPPGASAGTPVGTPPQMALEAISQGTPAPPAGLAGQITFSPSGNILYMQITSGLDVYEIDRVPSPATLSVVGTIGSGSGPFDAAVWPCTLPL